MPGQTCTIQDTSAVQVRAFRASIRETDFSPFRCYNIICVRTSDWSTVGVLEQLLGLRSRLRFSASLFGRVKSEPGTRQGVHA
jgi:hypothetical protein